MALDDIVISVTLDQAKVQADAQRLVSGFSQVGQQAATALLRGMEQGLNPLAIINALNKIEGVMAEFGNRVAGKSTIIIRQQMQEVTKSMDEAGKSATLFGVNLERAFSRVVVYGSVYRIIGAVTQAIEQSVKAAVELEFVFARLQRFGGGAAIPGAAFSLGQDFGVPTKDVASSLEVSTARFKDNAQAIDVSRQALKLHLLTGEDLVTSTKSIITIMEAYKGEGITATKIVDSLANVTAKSKTNIVDLQAALVGAGSEMASAGLKFDKFVGIITAMQLASGASGGEIVSSMTRLRARLTEAGPIRSLEEFGINVRKTLPGTNVGGSEIRDLGPILDEIGAKWATYSKTQQQAIGNALLGERAQREIVPAMNAYDQALQGAADSSHSFGKASEQIGPVLDTLVIRWERLKNAMGFIASKTLQGAEKLSAEAFFVPRAKMEQNPEYYAPGMPGSKERMIADQEDYKRRQAAKNIMTGPYPNSLMDPGSPGYSALNIGRELTGLSKGASAGLQGLSTTKENIVGLKLRFEAGMGPGTYTEFLSQVQALEKSLIDQAQKFLLTGSSGKIRTEMTRLTGHIMSGLGLVGAKDVAGAFGSGGTNFEGGSEALNKFLEEKDKSTDPTILGLIKEAKTLDTAIGLLSSATKKEADATKEMLRAAKEVLAEYHAQISGITSAITQTLNALPADFIKRADTGFTLRAQIPIETASINTLTAQRNLLQHNTLEWNIANDKVNKQVELVREMNKQLKDSQNYMLAFNSLLTNIGENAFKGLTDRFKKELEGLFKGLTDRFKKELEGLFADANAINRLLAGAVQGAGLGTLSAGAMGKDQTGGAIGGALLGAGGSALGGVALGGILGPLGGLIGGVLGGLLGGDDERKKKEAQDAAIKQQNQQLAELDQLKLANSHLSAIEHYTRPMSDLMEQLINAPSKFLLPISRGVLEGSITQGGVNAGFAAPHLAGGGYIEKTGLAVVHKGETVSSGGMHNTFHITGANAEEISKKVVEKINQQYNQSYLRTGNTIRRNAF